MHTIYRWILFALVAAAVCTNSTARAQQYTLTTLATFNGTNGAYPYAGLIADASGNLYGTTYGGGANRLRHRVRGGRRHARAQHPGHVQWPNGNDPYAGLIADASGNLYGTTSGRRGERTRSGTVFEVAAGTHALSTLATFNGTNGANPYAGLIADASGNLYGTTATAGRTATAPCSRWPPARTRSPPWPRSMARTGLSPTPA